MWALSLLKVVFAQLQVKRGNLSECFPVPPGLAQVDEFRFFVYLSTRQKPLNISPSQMEPIQFSMLFHYIGIGLIFAALLGGWILNTVYDNAGNYHAKLIILKSLRRIGLISPAAILVLLVTGGANMYYTSYSFSNAPWLTTKVIVFLIAATLGSVFGARGAKRAVLVSSLADGNAVEGAAVQLQTIDRQQRLFYMFQSIMILAILILSVFKP